MITPPNPDVLLPASHASVGLQINVTKLPSAFNIDNIHTVTAPARNQPRVGCADAVWR
jgi:hypothetical protein